MNTASKEAILSPSTISNSHHPWNQYTKRSASPSTEHPLRLGTPRSRSRRFFGGKRASGRARRRNNHSTAPPSPHSRPVMIIRKRARAPRGVFKLMDAERAHAARAVDDDC